MVLPKKMIKGYRDGAFEACTNQILLQNKEINKVGSPSWLSTYDTLPEVVEQVQNRGIWPGVEILWDDLSDFAYYIGPIVRQVDDGFFLRCYAADGTWEKEYHIAYADIFRIVIDGPYERHFNAYMRSKEAQ